MTAEQIAKLFHETYERLAPKHGYATRKESAKPWADVPEQNRNLMIEVARVVGSEITNDMHQERMHALMVVALLINDLIYAHFNDKQHWSHAYKPFCEKMLAIGADDYPDDSLSTHLVKSLGTPESAGQQG